MLWVAPLLGPTLAVKKLASALDSSLSRRWSNHQDSRPLIAFPYYLDHEILRNPGSRLSCRVPLKGLTGAAGLAGGHGQKVRPPPKKKNLLILPKQLFR